MWGVSSVEEILIFSSLVGAEKQGTGHLLSATDGAGALELTDLVLAS